MTTITDGLFNQLQGQPLNRIGQQLGLSQSQTANAVAAALPLLLGALSRNSSRPQGAQSLFGALQRDHVGLEPQGVLGSALDGGGQGGQILGHIFGQREPIAAQGLGAATGLAPDRANMLLRWLAPVAMAYLAKKLFDKRSANAAAQAQAPAPATQSAEPSPAVLGEVLQREEGQISQQGGLGGRLLGAVLDRNHDGKVDFSDLLAGPAGGRA